MMDLAQRMEQFSHAYVRAVASVAGYSLAKPEVDDDSIDLCLSSRSSSETPRRPRIDVQLECTSNDLLRDDRVVYPLKRKNYDDLRAIDVLTPRLLVVVMIPKEEEISLRQTEDELTMRRCGYWLSLRGKPGTASQSTVTISAPRSNLFDVADLRELMGRADRGEPL